MSSKKTKKKNEIIPAPPPNKGGGNQANKLLAFEMRFRGHRYEDIAIHCNYKKKTLYMYFSKNGKWHDEYQEWLKGQKADLTDRLSNMFIAQAIEANQMIVNLSRGYATVRITKGNQTMELPIDIKANTILSASQDILDRAGFKQTDKVEILDSKSKAEELTAWFDSRIAETKKKTKKKAK